MHTGRAPQPSTPLNFDMPANACDCHSHIFGPPDRFPFVAKRLYTPPPALPEELAAMHRFVHFERVERENGTVLPSGPVNVPDIVPARISG
jgi:hypothetical protein